MEFNKYQEDDTTTFIASQEDTLLLTSEKDDFYLNDKHLFLESHQHHLTNDSSLSTDSETTTNSSNISTNVLLDQQAILTTCNDWRIILSNSVAQDVFLLVVGKSVMDLIDPSFQQQLQSIIAEKRNESCCHSNNSDNDDDLILISGELVPIVQSDGTSSSAFLWLKEKRKTESGQLQISSVFIWIFEQHNVDSYQQETNNTIIVLSVNASDTVESAECNDDRLLQKIYGYHASINLIGHALTTLIPAYPLHTHHSSFFTVSQTREGAQLPVKVKRENGAHLCYQITSTPVIAGLLILDGTTIKDGNDTFVRHLFGFSQREIRNHPISTLLPQFHTLLDTTINTTNMIVTNNSCRKLLTTDPFDINEIEHHLKHLLSDPPASFLLAVHRDGANFEVQVQVVLTEDDEYAVWVSFDRDLGLKRFNHRQWIQPNNILPPSLTTTTTSSIISPNYLNKRSPKVMKRPADNDKSIITEKKVTTIDDYVILDHLGEGAYGLVKLAVKKDDSTQTKVVIKYIIKSCILIDCWTRDRRLGTLPGEIHILNTLRNLPHDNLCKMVDYFEDTDHYYVVMNQRSEDIIDLFDYIELNTSIPEDEIRRIFKQLASGVHHLHSNQIVHRDIKDENVIIMNQHLDGRSEVQLIDFGSAAYVKPYKKFETFVGTLDYAAPEILRGEMYSGKPQDIWSLGVLLFTLVYRETPFYDTEQIMKKELRIPFVLSEGLVDLICKMLERDVDKRIDIQQVLAHPWLNSTIAATTIATTTTA
ncbi:MAG: kinase-like domain-containing protein [Benjaminiella poitrasii]|nr:MAG: kinase-like domain-containing protein [Benjaminiella poitrasii]